MSIAAEPELSRTARLALSTAIRQFNKGLYFECHETLEAVWLKIRGPARDFFQGLIQVSVGFHHLSKGSRTGARRTFDRALGRFEAYPPRYCGFDLAAERVRLRALLETLRGNDCKGVAESPVWRLDSLPPT